MNIDQPHLAKTIAYYDPLLQRYARRLIHNDTIAAHIVLQVLECQYELNSLVPSKHLRQVLKADVLNCCFYHMQIKMFDREPSLIDCRNHLNIVPQTDTGKPPLLN